jgi:hypothetical protein
MKKLLVYLCIALFMIGAVAVTGCEVEEGIDGEEFEEEMEEF